MTNDKIELIRKNLDVDLSDPTKLTDTDFRRIWAEDCHRWHGHNLTGNHQHYCPDWDYLPIDDTCMEFEACSCKKDD